MKVYKITRLLEMLNNFEKRMLFLFCFFPKPVHDALPSLVNFLMLLFVLSFTKIQVII